LAGDLVANTTYYAAGLAFGPRTAQWLAPFLGAGAGVGSVLLPGPMGLDSDETSRTPLTKAMSVGLYLAGGIAAAATYRALSDEDPAS
jgi:hypothetical protein